MTIQFTRFEPAGFNVRNFPGRGFELGLNDRYTDESVGLYYVYWLQQKANEWANSCQDYSIKYVDNPNKPGSVSTSTYTDFALRFMPFSKREQDEQTVLDDNRCIYQFGAWFNTLNAYYGIPLNTFTESTVPGLEGAYSNSSFETYSTTSFLGSSGYNKLADRITYTNGSMHIPFPQTSNIVRRTSRRIDNFIVTSVTPGEEFFFATVPGPFLVNNVNSLRYVMIAKCRNIASWCQEDTSLAANWYYLTNLFSVSSSASLRSNNALFYPMWNITSGIRTVTRKDGNGIFPRPTSYHEALFRGSEAPWRREQNTEKEYAFSAGPWLSDLFLYTGTGLPLFSTGDDFIFGGGGDFDDFRCIENPDVPSPGITQLKYNGKLYLSIEAGLFVRIK